MYAGPGAPFTGTSEIEAVAEDVFQTSTAGKPDAKSPVATTVVGLYCQALSAVKAPSLGDIPDEVIACETTPCEMDVTDANG
jgi:hypothetical protein